MKRKLLILTVMLPMILAMLFSCSIGDGGADGDSDSSDGGSGDSGSGGSTDNGSADGTHSGTLIYDKTSDLKLVLGKDVDG